jgi:hypothetical protein
MLSGWRMCEAYFEEEFLSHPGKQLTPIGRTWGLEFGSYVHKCMEYFYLAQREDWEGHFPILDRNNASVVGRTPQNLVSFLQLVSDHWKFADLDWFMQPEFKKGLGKTAQALGGHDGAITLFTQYYKQYWRQERFRFVGSELTFGHGKEFLLYEFPCVVRFYYCGRIDQIVDDTVTIGPMDFKTASYFDGTERDGFKPDDGMQGYVAFVQHHLKSKFAAEGRLCNTMIIRHISVRYEKEERFKSSFITYTPVEMAMWHARQIKTFKQIYEALIEDTGFVWNTRACNNGFYYHKCPFKQLHDVSPAYRDGLIKTFYQIQDAWSYDRNGGNNAKDLQVLQSKSAQEVSVDNRTQSDIDMAVSETPSKDKVL